jgi:hypothetical protein
MKAKTTPRVQSLITLGEIIEECTPCGILFNHNQAHYMFEDYNGKIFNASILSKGNVKFEYLDGNTTKPYKWVNKHDFNKKKSKLDKKLKAVKI